MSIPTASKYPAALDDATSLFGDPQDQFATTLTSTINNAVTSFVVDDSISSIVVPTYFAFNTGEIVYVEAKTDGTKTFSSVTRSANPQPHTAGEAIRQILVANYIKQIKKSLIAIETELGVVPKGSHADVAAAIVAFDALLTSKAAASGIASLNGSSKVVQDPANATATPTASKIPIADGGGKVDGWVSGMTTSAIGAAQAATAAETTAGSLATKAVTPNAVAHSVIGERIITIALNGTVALTTSERAKFRIPASMNGMNLVSVAFNLGTDNSAGSSSSGNVEFSVQKATTNMLSTNPAATINNYEPTQAAVIKSDGSQTVATGNIINVETVTAGTGVTFAVITLEFQLP